MKHKISFLRGRVFDFINKFVKDPDLADDLTQDIMLKVWDKRDKLDSSSNLEYYVLKMAKHAVYDHFKKLTREKAYQEQVWLHIQRHASADSSLAQSDIDRQLANILKELPTRQQEVFTMHHEEELSLEEISQRLHIAPNTAKNHLFRALKVIRTRIKPELFLALVGFFS